MEPQPNIGTGPEWLISELLPRIDVDGPDLAPMHPPVAQVEDVLEPNARREPKKPELR
jgi:hypothetical protein